MTVVLTLLVDDMVVVGTKADFGSLCDYLLDVFPTKDVGEVALDTDR